MRQGRLEAQLDAFESLPSVRPRQATVIADGRIPLTHLDRLQIVAGHEAPELEGLAALELQRYLRMLYGVTIPVASVPDAQTPLVLVGSPSTNPTYEGLGLAQQWPGASEQGIVLKRLNGGGRPVWLVGGGSPVATLWAVYEFVERMGVRYLLSGDVFPDSPGPPLALPEVDEQREPVFRDRIWRVMNDEPHGPEMWSLDECRRVIDQLAKMKINAIFFNTYPSHPFVHYEFRGVKKSTGTLDFGFKYPIDGETIGKEVFGEVDEFINPEFRHCRTYDDWIDAGQRYAHELFAYAKGRGMRVGMGFSLTDPPPEFKERFHEWGPPTPHDQGERGPISFSRLGVVTVGTPPRDRSFQDVDNPALLELSEVIVRAHLDTYPDLDFISFGSAEHRSSVAGHQACWKRLDEKYGVESVAPLEGLIAAARSRHFHAEGRAEGELKADVEFLYFVDKLFTESRLLERLGRSDLQVILSPVTEELYAIIDRVLPKGFGTNSVIDYNLTLAAQRIETLDAMRDAKLDRYYNFSIQDDMNSLLVASEGARIQRFLDVLQRYGFRGWTSRYWSIGDLDHSTLFLTRASWESGLTPEEAYEDYIRHVFGEECLPEMREIIRLLEENGAFQGDELFAVGFPYPSLMRGHFEMKRHFAGQSGPREELLQCRDSYVRIRSLAKSALDKARHAGRSRLEYLIGRLETCALFLETAYTVEKAGFSYRAAQEAREVGEPFEAADRLDEAALLMEQSVELARRTTQAHVKIVRDESDVGLLAAMNEYMFKYLKAKAYLVHNEAISWRM